MAWRVARSLEVLTTEVRQLHPGTTVWTLGDAAHRATASDHNPNAADVVCAGDFLPDRGLNLQWFVDRVVASRHPALKYVIYNRRIFSVARASEGWRSYSGSNPHTGHAHVSVGRGPDGRSTGPYDDTSPWGLVEEDDMDPKDRLKVPAWVMEEYPEIGGKNRGTMTAETAWTSGYGHSRLGKDRITKYGREILAGQAAILAKIGGQDVTAAVRAELDRHRAQLVAELGEDLAEAVASELQEVPAEQVEAAVARALARTRLSVGDEPA